MTEIKEMNDEYLSMEEEGQELSSIVVKHGSHLITCIIINGVIIYGIHFYDLYWKRRFLPPGPTPWLFFGNILHLMFYKSIDDMFLEWKKKYGNVITFWIGPIPLIMVADVRTMREYFIRNAEIFSNRWRNYATDFFMGGANGIIQIDGDKWKQQRRFVLRILRDFGVGRILIEQQIMKEGSAEFSFLHSLLDFHSRLVMHPLMGLYITLPSTTRIPFLNYKWKQFKNLRDELWKFISREVQTHMKIFNCQEFPDITDFTYAYLSEINRRKGLVSRMNTLGINEWQLTMLLLDLFFAGMETTVTTLKWGFLLSIIHPDVQTKVQNELDEIEGRITLADKPKCSYTIATIHEIQRFANIFPINLLRTVAEDIVMGKYYYPAGTLCIPQISIAMNDPINFEKPRNFVPNILRYDAFSPFSIGKRQCLGESLAKAELFLIYANLMKQFRFRTAPNEPNPSTERLFGLTSSPPPYKCLVEKRMI
ncbi:hypothetical protein DINM_005064 [Dirofilaria immitis]|nr:hypothetical protein [Dirofilaria immitis]